MHPARLTRSQTRNLTIHPSTSISFAPASNASSDEVNDLISSSTLTPLHSPMADSGSRDAPPHMNSPAPEGSQAPEGSPAPEIPLPPAPPPALDQNLQQAMAAFFQAMTANVPAAPQAPIRAAQGRDGPGCQRVKAREPDPYDGSQPAKLRAFLSQCKLVFRSSPHIYDDDELKIMYAVSYLQGTALRWFEPILSLDEIDLPCHAYVWTAFENELQSMFGEPDPVALATQKLDSLTMKDSHHITKYNVEFNEYSTLTGFNRRALYAKYYKGLAPRIKDALVLAGRPNNLEDLRTRAQELDLRYWECKDEERAAAPSTSHSSKPSGSRSHGRNADASTSHSSRSNHMPSRTSSRASMPATSSSSAPASKSKKPDLLKVLGTDGKLLPEEKERRRKNGLCMLCGSKNHFVDKCPSNTNKTPARAAHLEELDEESVSEASASEDESSEPLN